jgi:hypothetical protein
MSDFETEMNRVVQGFVAQITDLARRAAINTLESALGKSSNGRRSGGATVTRAVGRGRGAKRSSDELDKLQDKFLDHVKANPGLRIEQINKQLGTTTKDLALPIRKLIADGGLKTKGEKRSTQYFAGEGGRKKKSKN